MTLSMRVTQQEYEAMRRRLDRTISRRMVGISFPDQAIAAIPKPAQQTWITLPYPPTANHLFATVGRRRVLSPEGKRYKEYVAKHLMVQGLKPVGGPVSFYLRAFAPDRRRRDLDNILKVVLDGMTGRAWLDDSQVAEIHARKFVDTDNPRVEVMVLQLDSHQA